MVKITKEQIEELGYRNVREVPGQGFCGIMDMLFTIGVFCRITYERYDFRYCFPKEFPPGTAEKELDQWNGQGHIGGPWIKCKGKGTDILNPRYESFFKSK